MELKKLRELIQVDINKLEVDATSVIEHRFFEKGGFGDYRQESINFCIKNKIDFHSTCNSAFNVMKSFIKIKCPVCKKNMEPASGSGSGLTETLHYVCACGTDVSLTIPVEGIIISFKENK